MLLKALFIFLLFELSLCEYARYDNYRVYVLKPNTKKQFEILSEIEKTSDSFIFLKKSKIKSRETVIVVPPHKFADFTNLIEKNNFLYEIEENNLQESIDEERNRQLRRTSTEFGWDDYQSLERIYKWLDRLIEEYPHLLTSVVAGKTYEGREIRAVKLSYKSGNTGVVLEGGMHAREWISPATTTFILNQLITSDDKNIRRIAESFDWYIIPVANPDGYVYTFTKDRLWRKTRSLVSYFCYGADPNRNFDNHWGELGSSIFPCSEIYAGKNAFSEIEAKSLSEFFYSLKGNITTYISFHSFSQLILYPYGYQKEHPDNYDDLVVIANKTVEALSVRYGTKYDHGTINDIIYPISGSSLEWIYDNVGTKISFAFELRPDGKNRKGFILPPEQIIPTGEETLDSIAVLLDTARNLGYYDV